MVSATKGNRRESSTRNLPPQQRASEPGQDSSPEAQTLNDCAVYAYLCRTHQMCWSTMLDF